MSGNTAEVLICLDEYRDISIKASERKLRGSTGTKYSIAGPEQTVRQCPVKFLSSATFKDESSKLFLKECGKNHYSNMYNGKPLYVSYGGHCYRFIPDEN